MNLDNFVLKWPRLGNSGFLGCSVSRAHTVPRDLVLHEHSAVVGLSRSRVLHFPQAPSSVMPGPLGLSLARRPAAAPPGSWMEAPALGSSPDQLDLQAPDPRWLLGTVTGGKHCSDTAGESSATPEFSTQNQGFQTMFRELVEGCPGPQAL